MKKAKLFICFYLLGFVPSLALSFMIKNPDMSNQILFGLADEKGVNNYKSPQNVTYKMETSLFLQDLESLSAEYCFQLARYNNRTYESPLTSQLPPYQISQLKSLSINGNDTPIQFKQDKFNNTYDMFNATLGTVSGSEVTIDLEYEITLNEIEFANITDEKIGKYDQSDKIFELYCNKSQQFFETSNADLISLSNSIVSSGDNPVEKAEKIFNWITENIDYVTRKDEEGALYAYNNKKGDCSEFSDLMITLLRIQEIPARKVTGFVLTNDLTAEIEEEQEWNFDQSYDSDTKTLSSENPYLGHAWVEYYVPNIGWIECDPTWGVQQEVEYFNRIDYMHFCSTVGSWIFYPPDGNFSEFPFLPTPSQYIEDSTNYEINTRIIILETNFAPQQIDPELWMIILTTILVIAIIAAIVATVVVIIKKVFKNEKN